jgi:hypothetical protein
MSGSDQFFGRVQDNWRQRAHEKSTFATEFRLIPQWLINLLVTLYVLAVVIVEYVSRTVPGAMPDPLVDKPELLQLLAMFGIVTAIAIPCCAYILLIGYIRRDAKRRGMSPVLWMLIAIFVPYLIGVVFYFALREPLPFECPRCSRPVNAQFNFCPGCQCNLRPICPHCRREIRPGDRFCPHCGVALEAAESAQAPPESAG